jgi:hypothetical protein
MNELLLNIVMSYLEQNTEKFGTKAEEIQQAAQKSIIRSLVTSSYH